MSAYYPDTQLVGLRVLVSISEPWEFQSEVGTGSFEGRIQAIRSERTVRLVVELTRPLTFGGVTLNDLVATARYVEESVLEVRVRRHMVCTFVPSEPLVVEEPSGRHISHFVGTLEVLES